MKTIFKRWLLLGMSMSFMVLAAIRSWGDPEPTPSPDPGSVPDSSAGSKSGSHHEPADGGPAEAKLAAESTMAGHTPEHASRSGPQLVGPQLVQGRPLRSEPDSAARPAVTVSFSGIVVRMPETTGADAVHRKHFALRETAGTLYPLDSDTRALPWEGESVRVTGDLDIETRTLNIDMIQPTLGRQARRA